MLECCAFLKLVVAIGAGKSIQERDTSNYR